MLFGLLIQTCCYALCTATFNRNERSCLYSVMALVMAIAAAASPTPSPPSPPPLLPLSLSPSPMLEKRHVHLMKIRMVMEVSIFAVNRYVHCHYFVQSKRNWPLIQTVKWPPQVSESPSYVRYVHHQPVDPANKADEPDNVIFLSIIVQSLVEHSWLRQCTD